ncbi:tetratricopeptide repeat protein [Sungkyunkwania multivorans]|uniref:Tetratricopeptide repeat protein n=1 Tax=Sungkyunkwania multivorans TaxID=1173618 RepID=A0ABW3D3J6_9FLAO
MKQKFTILMMALVGATSIATAQYDAQDCVANLSIFVEHAKVKNYDAAYEPWMLVRKNCPQQSSATFVYGERILKDRIKNGADKKAEVNDLIKMYDEWAQYFPTKKGVSQLGKIYAKKALQMIDNNVGTDADAYAVLNKGYTEDKASFSDPKALYYYFKLYYDQYKGGSVTLESLFERYEELTEKFEDEIENLSKKLDKMLKKEEAGTLTKKDQRNMKVYETNSKAIGLFQGNMDALISGEASCENLIPLYEKNFEENKTNAIWLNRAASRMLSKECDTDPLFIKIVEGLDGINPSSDSKLYLANLYANRGDYSKSEDYLKQSIDLESDPYKKARKLYRAGLISKKKGRKAGARSYFNQAVAIQPSMGKAYMQIGYLYASSANDCGGSQFEKRAIYWRAVDMFRKAGRVDASLRSTTDKLVDSYMQRAPSKTDIFQQGMQGKTININCWIGGTVKVPSL